MTQSRLLIDEAQIRTFANTIFRYASDGQVISLRSFLDDGKNGPAVSINPVTINGAGLEPLISTALMEAQFAADHGKRVVFCPPIAGFSVTGKADEPHLVEGYTLSVECDQGPARARQTLEQLLGAATVVVASGGEWTDPATGEVHAKLHLHWRLKEAATGADLPRLKEARRLATRLVGGDTSNVTIVHPIRWPGSWHRKGEPRLARIISQTDSEIELSDALEKLEGAAPKHPKSEQTADPEETNGDREELKKHGYAYQQHHKQ